MAIKVDSADNLSGGHRIGTSMAEINIIPLVDVTLVLLLIFMTPPSANRGWPQNGFQSGTHHGSRIGLASSRWMRAWIPGQNPDQFGSAGSGTDTFTRLLSWS